MRIGIAALNLILLLGVAGCGSGGESPDPHETGEQDEHLHSAPHGGVLVELGDHVANLEVVVNANEGSLHLYILDAHAENAIRIADPMLPVVLISQDDTRQEVEFRAVASSITGETVGDTSEFEYRGTSFTVGTIAEIVIPKLDLRGLTVEEITIVLHEEHASER